MYFNVEGTHLVQEDHRAYLNEIERVVFSCIFTNFAFVMSFSSEYFEKTKETLKKPNEILTKLRKSLTPLVNFDEICAKFSQISAKVPKKQNIQECNSDNLVDLEKCCKMHLFSLS